VAEDPEALAQIARLLGDERLRTASAEDVRVRVDQRLEQLADGLLAEATASDDVIDRESALDFLNDRLRFFGALLSEGQRTRLLAALREKIEAW
jgi:hypothetical protein